uniref:Cytochrome P450 93A1 n=1 Tax=Anthurium amnicola TaxID=1678845 RepID=A0A1D1XIA2_9ARAE
MDVEGTTPTWVVYLATALVSVSLLGALLEAMARRKRGLRPPPGPRPWPVIGSLHLIGALPHRSIHELSRRYGPIMQLYLGSQRVVVGSSVEIAKEFLKTHDVVFADRPRTAAGKYTTYNYSDITWSPYGPYWRQARKMCLMELFSTKRLDSYEYIRVEELRGVLRRLHAGGGATVDLKDCLSTLSLNVISRMVLGRSYTDGGGEEGEAVVSPEEFKRMLDELFLLNGVLNVGDMIPWLDFLDLQGYVRRMKALSKKFHSFLDHVIDEHNERRRRMGAAFVPRDMVDVLLQLADDPGLDVKFTRDGVKGFTQDMLAGGTESSAVTVEWAMSELLRKPHIMEKAAEELDRVVGRDRWVEEKDMPQLPYVEAIAKETMRLHPVAPMLVPRYSREDCTIAGYDIRRLRHPRRHRDPGPRLVHRARPQSLGLPRGLHARAVPGEGHRRQGPRLRAAALRCRPADVPRLRTRPPGHPGQPRQPPPRLQVETARGHEAGGPQHGGDLWAVHPPQGPPGGGRRATATSPRLL